jgi:lysophospholipase L1-like esterase
VRLLGICTLVLLFACLTACTSETRNGERGTDGGGGSGTGPQATTEATDREAEAGSPDDGDTWNYVALGDSLAEGVGARRGYVDMYADHLRRETGARVELDNLGVSGQTSSQLLHAIRNDPSMRQALRGAEAITYNIGINDLGQAWGSYDAETCGGARGERCLHAAVEDLDDNWNDITAEILSLTPDETVIRTAGLGYTPHAGRVAEPYLKQVNRNIASSSDDNGIPYAEVSLGEKGLSSDGLHPNESGYDKISTALEELGVQN